MFRYKKINTTITDTELISLYKKTGDNSNVGELFKRYSHLVFGVCMKYLKDEDESKDAVMQVFEKLLDDLKKYNVENFKSWLHTTTKNHCLMKLRSIQSVLLKSEELKKDFSVIMENDYELHHDNVDNNDFYLSQLGTAIETLIDEQKICIELFYLKEKCYQEVAEITGYSMLQVKSYIQNGKRNLKIFIQNKYERQVK
ncbi:MAG: sigma-70 family RNA polymerase sigma factor [Bacteroidales bacterium]